MLRIFSYLILFFSILTFVSCGNKQDSNETKNKDKKEFGWSEELKVSDIPDYKVKGMLNGKEVQFQSITFEKWNGPGDNVINFALSKPEQPCGFIEKYEGFQLGNKGNAINQGEWTKSKFTDDVKTYDVFFKYIGSDGNSFKSSSLWNCALSVEQITSKSVKGKIALCFNDDKKSWVAGNFEASICNN